MHKSLIAAVAALLASPAWSNTLVSNVNGLQVGSDGKLQRFSALLIGDDGKVLNTFTSLDNVRVAASQSIDGGGRTLLPGLIDGHGHVISSPGGGAGLGLFLQQLDLTQTRSLADLQRRLAGYASNEAAAGWIQGRGWNQESWSERRFPTAADLDAVVRDRPVVLERVDGHAIVVNTAALKIAGINAGTKDPAGGKVERDSSGRPTGILIDNAIALISDKLPKITPNVLDRALEAAQSRLLANGITAAADMGTSPEDWAAMQRAAAAGKLKVRIMSYADGSRPLALSAPSGWLYADRLRMGGVKLYADGALGSRGAWLKQPYADKQDTRGLQFLTDAQLRDQAGRAAALGYQVAVHAIGDAANAQVLSAYEGLSRKHGNARRWRIEHFQIVDTTDLGRLAPAGIIASMQPTHQTSDRLMAEARLGPNRLAGAYAWQSVLKSGARIAFGSDFPVESPNPFPGLSAAVSRQDMNGQPPGGWLPAERVTFAQALDGFTRGAAYAGFAETRIGALEAGKWADFILVDRDVSSVDPQALARTQVLETWVAGKKVWERVSSAAGRPERGK